MNKKFLIIPSILLSFSVYCQKIDSKDLPEGVSMTFKIKFPDVTSVKWEKEGEDFTANFNQGGMETEASFFLSGQWKETEYEMPVKTIPAKITDYINANYKGSKINEFQYLDAVDGKFYVIEIKNSSKKEVELFFNLDGTFIKQEVEENKTKEKATK